MFQPFAARAVAAPCATESRAQGEIVLIGHFARGKRSPWNNIQPIREEFFGDERLAQHAASLAHAQTVAPRQTFGPSLVRRLKHNADHLL
ncbi:hypothetical protein, partial [Burkholderia gladioli]|uniref:hypothetical protein n=1 Tax=Burkholderia gladioli TaxID=28095 RepID=UPI001C61223B